MANATEETIVEEGCGNVFADLGLPNPEERLTKAKLASAILEGRAALTPCRRRW